MAGRVHHPRGEIADGEGVAILEQAVELAAVAGDAGTGIEDPAEGLLDRRDMLADAELRAEARLQEVSGAQMIGMDMSFQDPIDRQMLRCDVRQQPIGGAMPGPARCRVEIEHAIDDRTALGDGIGDGVADGKGFFVEETDDVRVHFPSGCESPAAL